MEAIVRCTKCGQEHQVKDVEFLNIEEDIQGRDLMTYTCPVTGEVAKAYVLG